MTQNDKQKFLQAMNGCAAVYRVPLTEQQLGLYWDALKDFSVDEFSEACSLHIKSAKFFPTPAELIQLIPAAQIAKHVDADEAWAIVLTSMDEAETVVMTQPMLEARGIAWPIWQDGDEIGARMAFRSAYNRIIATANPPAWQVIAGWDAERRLPAIEQAKRLGRLPEDYRLNQNLLPTPAAETTVFGLLENLEKRLDRTEEEAKKGKRHIANIRDMLGGDDAAKNIAERQKQREAFELHRQQELAKLAQKAGGVH